MMRKEVKAILNLVINDEGNATLIKKIENSLVKEEDGFKSTIQQLQQDLDLIENLNFVVETNRRAYDDVRYEKIKSKINSLLDEIRLHILKLKLN